MDESQAQPKTAVLQSIDKLEFWSKHFLEWQQSGESQADYCRKRNLSYAKFCYWRYHVKRSIKQKKSKPAQNKLVPVTVKANKSLSFEEGAVVSIRLPNGVTICVPSGIDTSQHKLVMQLLGMKS